VNWDALMVMMNVLMIKRGSGVEGDEVRCDVVGMGKAGQVYIKVHAM
jgi:hypothetical protein